MRSRTTFWLHKRTYGIARVDGVRADGKADSDGEGMENEMDWSSTACNQQPVDRTPQDQLHSSNRTSTPSTIEEGNDLPVTLNNPPGSIVPSTPPGSTCSGLEGLDLEISRTNEGGQLPDCYDDLQHGSQSIDQEGAQDAGVATTPSEQHQNSSAQNDQVEGNEGLPIPDCNAAEDHFEYGRSNDDDARGAEGDDDARGVKGDDARGVEGDENVATGDDEQEMEPGAGENAIQDLFDLEMLSSVAGTESIKEQMAFIELLREASLDQSDLKPDEVERLRNPIQRILEILDPNERLSLDLYLALEHSSQDTYGAVRAAIIRRYPSTPVLTFDQVHRKVTELSGVMPLSTDMCPNTCLAYTGVYAKDTVCRSCSEPRYDQRELEKSNGKKLVPRRQFQTIPFGPQIQAAWRHPVSAKNMRYRAERTEEILNEATGPIKVYNDYIHGSDYLQAVRDHRIGRDDIALMFSIDGAQLYQSKASDCWIYIWVILNYSPELRYKKRYVLPGAIIPGPQKPKHLESFLFPGLSHLSALQKEGLTVWDALEDRTFTSFPFLVMATADGPAMSLLNGLVGHHGKSGCRLYCGIAGRHKQGGTHYYPALSKPDNYEVSGSDHPDIDIYTINTKLNTQHYHQNLSILVQASTDRQHKALRLQTGIAKPSIFMGLVEDRTLGIPRCFPLDIMHLVSLNLSELLLQLWRAAKAVRSKSGGDSVEKWSWAVLKDEQVWERHGRAVAGCRNALPCSFDRPPRNPADKLNSGYKAFEFLNYIFGLGPGLFLHILPEAYYENYCKLVRGIRIMQQHHIPIAQLKIAHRLLLEFVRDFEDIYYQRNKERLQFVRQSIHVLLHVAPETCRLGPLAICSQWPMERTIGNLGEEIKQHSNPFANLSQRGARRCRVNALIAMVPDLDPNGEERLPRGALDLGQGYCLLRAMEQKVYRIVGLEATALLNYLSSRANYIRTTTDLNEPQETHRWARLRLPIGQTARSLFKESVMKVEPRISRNVKFIDSTGKYRIAEVQYFFRLKIDPDPMEPTPLAMVSIFSEPDGELLTKSSGALYASTYVGRDNLAVIDVRTIQSVVAMVKLPGSDPDEANRVQSEETSIYQNGKQYFLVEKIGLETLHMAGHNEDVRPE